MVDGTVLARLDGRERTEAEYWAFFARAGTHLERVVPTTLHAVTA